MMNALAAPEVSEETDRLCGQPSASTGQLENCPVLLVDDDPAVGEFLTEALKLYGYEVEAVENCLQAREKLRSGLYSSIVLDVVLPGTSGIYFYYGIKALWPDLAPRVIFLTGAIERHPHLGMLQQEGRPVLLKPIRTQELLAVLWALDQRLQED